MGTPHSLNRTPHKHAALIKAWADGAEIQYYNNAYNKWKDVDNPSWGNDTYRIKPKTIKYRNFIWRPGSSIEPDKVVVCVVSYKENLQEPRAQWCGFIRWLGDWQEVEI